MSEVIKDISALAPNAQTACRTFLSLCENAGLKVRITETYRTQKRQDELYAQGRTAPGSVVTWTKKSRHTGRRAWDICQDIKGREYSDISFFERCGKIAHSINVTWGGEWTTPDRPHFEVGTDWSLPPGYYEEVTDTERIDKIESELEAVGKRIDMIEGNMPKIYHYTVDVPEWGRKTVQKLLDLGYFSGAASDDLNLSEEMLRLFVILDRAGSFDR